MLTFKKTITNYNTHTHTHTHKKKNQELLYFMDKFQLKSQFSESTTKVGSQLDHIWANVL
jgi:hypothetical protein